MSTGAAHYLQKIIGRFAGPDSSASLRDQYTGVNLSLKVMALLSAADGRVDEAEVRLAQEVYAANAGGAISPELIRRSVEIAVQDQDQLWRELATSDRLEPSVREDIYAFACRVAAVDGELHPHESAMLSRIGRTLGLSAARMETLGTKPDALEGPAAPTLDENSVERLRKLINPRAGQNLQQIFARINSVEEGLTPEQRNRAIELCLNAMALMCLADGNVDDAELRLTGEVYAALGGGDVADHTLRRAVDIVKSEQAAVWRAFDAAGDLSEVLRQDILRAAFRVAQVDGRVDEAELALLQRIGEQLQVPSETLAEIAAG